MPHGPEFGPGPEMERSESSPKAIFADRVAGIGMDDLAESLRSLESLSNESARAYENERAVEEVLKALQEVDQARKNDQPEEVRIEVFRQGDDQTLKEDISAILDDSLGLHLGEKAISGAGRRIRTEGEEDRIAILPREFTSGNRIAIEIGCEPDFEQAPPGGEYSDRFGIPAAGQINRLSILVSPREIDLNQVIKSA